MVSLRRNSVRRCWHRLLRHTRMRGRGYWEVRKMGRVEEKEGSRAVGGQLVGSCLNRGFSRILRMARIFGDFCLLSVFVRMARLETLTVWGRKLESLRYKHQRSASRVELSSSVSQWTENAREYSFVPISGIMR